MRIRRKRSSTQRAVAVPARLGESTCTLPTPPLGRNSADVFVAADGDVIPREKQGTASVFLNGSAARASALVPSEDGGLLFGYAVAGTSP
jgi:hypothetical protein